MNHPPETNEPLLSHNEESMTEYHRPQPSQSSRELAQQIIAQFSHFEDGVEWVTNPNPEKLRQVITDLVNAYVREERDMAHAAAIHAAATIPRRNFGVDSGMAKEILALTHADAQRLYDLRITEARLDAMTWCTGAMSLSANDNAIIQKAIDEERATIKRLAITNHA